MSLGLQQIDQDANEPLTVALKPRVTAMISVGGETVCMSSEQHPWVQLRSDNGACLFEY